MTATGMVRQLDDLGRIVIPMDLRRSMGAGPGTRFEIMLDTVGEEKVIVLRLYHPRDGCVFCGRLDGTREFGGKRVCTACVDAISGLRGTT